MFCKKIRANITCVYSTPDRIADCILRKLCILVLAIIAVLRSQMDMFISIQTSNMLLSYLVYDK